jgi:hypothetical protein
MKSGKSFVNIYDKHIKFKQMKNKIAIAYQKNTGKGFGSTLVPPHSIEYILKLLSFRGFGLLRSSGDMTSLNILKCIKMHSISFFMILRKLRFDNGYFKDCKILQYDAVQCKFCSILVTSPHIK